MNPTIRKEQNDDEPTRYSVPATLVHWLIAAILSSLISIAGYMVVWAVNDREWKTSVNAKIEELVRIDSRTDFYVKEGILPVAKQRIDDLNRRVERLEQEHSRNSK